MEASAAARLKKLYKATIEEAIKAYNDELGLEWAVIGLNEDGDLSARYVMEPSGNYVLIADIKEFGGATEVSCPLTVVWYGKKGSIP